MELPASAVKQGSPVATAVGEAGHMEEQSPAARIVIHYLKTVFSRVVLPVAVMAATVQQAD